MATHPDDSSQGASQPPQGKEGKPNPKHTKVARQPSKPTMIGRDDDDPDPNKPGVPNMSLEESVEEIPVLKHAEPDADEGEEVVLLEAADEATDDDVVALEPADEAEPVFDDVEAKPVEVTGADHVLEDEVAAAHPGSDVLDIVEPDSELEDVLGDEPLDRGSRPSARVESPIRAEAEDAVDLGASPSGRQRVRDDLDATEEVLAGEPSGIGSSVVNWNDVGGISDVAKPVQDEETLAFAADDEDDESAVNLGGPPASKGKSSASGIDAVAEALESGVNLDDEAASPVTPPSVEFDDILTDADESQEGSAKTDDDLESTGKGKKKKKKRGMESDELELFGGADKPAKKRADADEEDEAAAALFGDDEEAVAAPVDDEAEAIAVPADEEEAVAALVEDEEEAPPRKKGKGRAAAEDEEETSAKKGKTKAPPVAATGPGCFGQLVRGVFFMIVGMMLLAGAGAGVAFVAPEMLDEYYGEIPGVKLRKPLPPAPPHRPSPVELAAQKLAAGEYAQAFDEVKDDNDPAAQAIRGAARFLKHAKEAKGQLKKDDAEVKKALEELRAGKNDVLANQIEGAFDAQGKLAAADQLLRTLKDTAEKNGAKVADAKDLPRVLTETLARKKQADDALMNLGAALAKANVVENAEDATPDKVEKKLKALNDTQTAYEGVNKVLKDANVKSPGAKGVGELLASRKDADDKLTAVDKALADAKVKDAGAKGVHELADARGKLQKDRDELDATTKAAYDELVKAKVVPAGSDPRKGLIAGARAARAKGESPLAIPLTHLGSALGSLTTGIGTAVARGMDTGLLAAELGMLKAREPFIQTPVQKLDTYALLLQNRSYNDPKQVAAILRETDWVLSRAARVSPADRAKALYVSGLALRNEGKFDEARKALDGAAKHAGIKGSAVEKQTQTALAELTDPRVYFLPKIDRLQADGDLKGALAQADGALAVLPGNGKLLAERALLRLETHRGKGKLSAEAQQQIRKDADAAIKTPAGAADGAFVLGRLDEVQGQYAAAEAHYRAALKAHKGSEDEASRYRAALGRVLLTDRPIAAPAPDEKAPPAEKKDAEAALPVEPTAVVHPLTALLLPALIGQAFDEPEAEVENAATAMRVRESIDLAKTLAASKDPRVREEGYRLLTQAVAKAGAKLTSTTCLELGKSLMSQPDPRVRGTGFLLTAHGMVKQGRRTEGLKEYVRGLELVHPGLESKDIMRMVEEHPAFQHPDAANKPNPLLAEKHFGAGLHLYWSKKYPAAEAQFKQALDYFGQDARYSYFLGLAQLAQRSTLKRDQAYFSFERGAQLEAQGRPGMSDVNASLERIQGGLRQLLNAYRFKGVATAAP